MRFIQVGYFLLKFRFFPVLAFLFYFGTATSQTCTNQWIQYDQKYFRFPVGKSGIYRLNYQIIQNAIQPYGFQLENIPPANLQVWSRGHQLFLRVEDGSDEVLNPGDFIEFYAEGNDGWYDSAVYHSPADQINPFYSLFNDTAFCYFSWNATGNNLRIAYDTLSDFSSEIPIPYVYSRQQYVFKDTYLEGKRYNTGNPDVTVGNPAYDPGEGYSGNKIWVNHSQSRNIYLPGMYSGGPPAVVNFTVVGGSNRELIVNQHHVRVDVNTTPVLDTLYDYNVPVTFSRIIPLNQFPGGLASMIFRNIEIPGQIYQEWASVSHIDISYPRNLDYQGNTENWFQVPEIGTQNHHYVKFSGISLPAGDSIHLYDISNHRMIKTMQQDGFIQALITNLPGEENCYWCKSSAILPVQRLVAVESSSASFTSFLSPEVGQDVDYIIITNSNLMNEALQYAQYRRLNGFPKQYHPLVVDIDQLYDQFAFGIPKNPLSVKNFIDCFNHAFPNQLSHVFLIGKSFLPTQYRNDAINYRLTSVPTWGFPPSDNLLLSNQTQSTPHSISIGRLSAYTKENVLDYLSKISEFEFRQHIPQLNQKNVLQFGGGASFLEQLIFKNYLLQYDSILSAPFFGGGTLNFFKQSTVPVEVNQSQYLHDLIENKGVALINYFAHASGISFDMSLGNPEDYNNQGKYYFVTANSCWAGDIFNYHGGLSSEHYVLLPQKGAIGYLASVTEGETPYLNAYTERFMKYFSHEKYGKSVGEIISATINDILQDTSLSAFGYKETAYEMTLHGDPALVINSPEYPDYSIGVTDNVPSPVSFLPGILTTAIDSFLVRIIQDNNGKALDTSYFVRVQRLVNNTILSDTIIRFRAPLYRDTLYVKIPILKYQASGLNSFVISLNPFHEIDENGRDNNNSFQTNVFIRSSDVAPLMPPQFSIVPQLNVTLVASTADVFVPERSYQFQLDTTPHFDSPLHFQKSVTQMGGAISCNLDLPLSTDSMVYFWRCAAEVLPPDSIYWHNSSFQYISGKAGWSQAHFLQMEENNYQYVNYLKDSLKFVYVQDVKSLVVQTFITNHPWQEENYKINNNVMDIWSCAHTACYGSTGLKLAVFDPVSFQPWFSYDTLNGTGPFGNRHCKAYPTPSFDFCNNDAANRQLITHMIQTVPEGYYVMAMSHLSPKTQEFEEPLYQAFESIGSGSIRQVADTSSYIIFGKKGWLPGQAYETGLNSSRDSLLHLNVSIQTNWNQGSITSPWIGPSKSWHSIHFKVSTEQSDSVGYMVKAIKYDGSIDTVLREIPADSADLYQLEQLIPAKIYPFLQLVLLMKDKSDHLPTPAILKRWQVLYDPLPETGIDPSASFSFYKDTVSEGDDIRLVLAYHNISEENMDSLLVKYWLKNENGEDTLIYKRLRPHPAHDILTDSLVINTLGKTGHNNLGIEINPDADQPEFSHVNNYGQLDFCVISDKMKPLLDVTFDGIHIMDYDYVSPNTYIQLSLSDDNAFLRLNDTAAIRVWLQEEGMPENEIFYGNGKNCLNFISANALINKCIVAFRPDLLHDGLYTLRVRAVDRSGNASGSTDYLIHFQVLHESLQSHMLAFPNPFREFTRFAFVLSGSCVPKDLIISITTVDGKKIREFNQDQFGPVHIGTNISNFYWDGRDQHGNLLPNGVYFYKTEMKFPCAEPDILNNYKGKYWDFSSDTNGKIIIMR